MSDHGDEVYIADGIQLYQPFSGRSNSKITSLPEKEEEKKNEVFSISSFISELTALPAPVVTMPASLPEPVTPAITNEIKPEKMSMLPSKTPVSVLQELLSRRGNTPKYELLQEEGAIHEPTFKYRVSVGEIIATGTGRSKKEAKHAAAKEILDRISKLKNDFPGVHAQEEEVKENGVVEEDGAEWSNPIGMLQELCMTRRWTPPFYQTVNEQGLPHERLFTIACSVLCYKELGVGNSKKVAKRLAAHKMLLYLRRLPSEDNNGSNNELDDDDELAQKYNHMINLDSGGGKIHSKKSGARGSKVANFRNYFLAYRDIPKIQEIQTCNFEDSSIDTITLLKEVAEALKVTVSYMEIEEKTNSGQYQCLVQLATVPIAVIGGCGSSKLDAEKSAALHALYYIKILTK